VTVAVPLPLLVGDGVAEGDGAGLLLFATATLKANPAACTPGDGARTQMDG
jgi:hypothetical protein